MNSWTILPAPVPDDLDSPEAWALHGASRVTYTNEMALWGYPDLSSPSPYLAAQMRAQTYVAKHLLVAVLEGSAAAGSALTADDVAGFAQVELPRHDNTHLAFVVLCVAPDRRRSGAGSALLAEADRIAAADGRTTVIAWTESAGEPPAGAPDVLEPPTGSGRLAAGAPGVRLALRDGYTLEQAERYSVLRLPVDPDHIERLHADAAAVAGSDYRLVSWNGHTPDEWVDQYAVLKTRMSTDVPTAELSIEETPWDAARVRAGEADLAASGLGRLVVAAEHIPTGALAAFTFVRYPKPWAEIVFQDDTMVLKEHRGRRLGMLVKSDLLRRLREVRPDAARIHTWNAEENSHMLAINVALGFAPTGVIGMWQKRLTA